MYVFEVAGVVVNLCIWLFHMQTKQELNSGFKLTYENNPENNLKEGGVSEIYRGMCVYILTITGVLFSKK